MNAKIVSLTQPKILKEDPFPDKVSLDVLRKIWNDDRYSYTNDELMRIREWLYAIATVTVRVANENIRQGKLKNELIEDYDLKLAS